MRLALPLSFLLATATLSAQPPSQQPTTAATAAQHDTSFHR